MGTQAAPKMRSIYPEWWKWVVLAATVYMSGMVNGYAYCFGILKIQLNKEYPEISQMSIAIIGGLVPALYLFLAPFGIALNEYTGPRFVTILGSILSSICFVLAWLNGIMFRAGFLLDVILIGVGQGVSFALLYGPSFAVLPSYFGMSQLSLATGITSAGASIGVIVYGFISNPLFDIYGMRGTFLFYAILSLQGVLAGCAFAPMIPVKSKPVVPASEDIEMAGGEKNVVIEETEPPKITFLTVLKKYFDSKLICQGPFVLLLGSAAFSIIGYFVPTFLVPPHAKREEYGIHPVVAKYIMVVFGLCNLVARLVFGRLGDFGHLYISCTSFTFYVGGLVVAAAACLIFPFAMPLGNVAFVAYIVVYSIAAAPIITMRSLLTIVMWGKSNANASFGWFLCAQGSMQMLGYILPSWLDAAMGAVYAYVFAAFMFIGAAVCCAATAKLFFTERRKMIARMKAEEEAAAEEKKALDEKN